MKCEVCMHLWGGGAGDGGKDLQYDEGICTERQREVCVCEENVGNNFSDNISVPLWKYFLLLGVVKDHRSVIFSILLSFSLFRASSEHCRELTAQSFSKEKKAHHCFSPKCGLAHRWRGCPDGRQRQRRGGCRPQLCQPELAVPEPVINVGKFGWFDGWKDKPFECVVRNRAEIPLCFTCTPSAADVAVSYPLPRTASEELSYAAPLPSGDAWAQV